MTPDWTDKPARIRTGEELDNEKLDTYVRHRLPGLAGELRVQQYPSGFSNLTYAVQIGDLQLVLRRPPFGAKIKSAHDMSREYRILSALIQVYPKVPRALFYCDDDSVIGAPFYLMERVEGVILRPGMPEAMQPNAEMMGRISRSWVDSLAELHAVDYRAAGLEELGRPSGYVQRQVEGWARRYENARTDDIPGMARIVAWLMNNMPESDQVGLIHNDYKYDNVVLDPGNWSRVIAILDWEMATLGDPLMDLGTSLAYWINSDDPPIFHQMLLSPTTSPGNPKRADIVERYSRVSGRDVDNIVFYYVYGLLKIAVIAQQIYHRYKMGQTADKRFAALIHGVKACSELAIQAMAKNRIDRLFNE